MRALLLLATTLLLTGCLEVEQYPAWREGHYNGKPDNLPQQLRFNGDRLAWNAAIDNRNRHQNEYARMRP
ncbi:hypothetical protein [uncultured Azohydromonas sp.]|jgi:hypothetical protein|uniref:hypothetical protein n=1 Tax=uncultured Azohydromonas sp. TaxID=487342 RepID=UPI002630D467|nr:hypothetical protein [uncultured Azohydromonas sp.]